MYALLFVLALGADAGWDPGLTQRCVVQGRPGDDTYLEDFTDCEGEPPSWREE